MPYHLDEQPRLVSEPSMASSTQSPVSRFIPRSVFTSPWVRRLADVSFLGTLDWQPDCAMRTSRLEHSVAVAELAIAGAFEAGLTATQTRDLAVAGLLHDVGHFPLSHSAEGAFRTLIGGSHHDVARWVICGDECLPRASSLAPLLEREGLDPHRIWALIAGDVETAADHPLLVLLSAPINFDTLEGIRRTARSFGWSLPTLGVPKLTQISGELHIRSESIGELDDFWRLKNGVYTSLINRPSNVIVERLLSDAVRDGGAPKTSLLRWTDETLLQHLKINVPAASWFRETDASWSLQPASDGRADRTLKRYEIAAAATREVPLASDQWEQRWIHHRIPARLTCAVPSAGHLTSLRSPV